VSFVNSAKLINGVLIDKKLYLYVLNISLYMCLVICYLRHEYAQEFIKSVALSIYNYFFFCQMELAFIIILVCVN